MINDQCWSSIPVNPKQFWLKSSRLCCLWGPFNRWLFNVDISRLSTSWNRRSSLSGENCRSVWLIAPLVSDVDSLKMRSHCAQRAWTISLLTVQSSPNPSATLPIEERIHLRSSTRVNARHSVKTHLECIVRQQGGYIEHLMKKLRDVTVAWAITETINKLFRVNFLQCVVTGIALFSIVAFKTLIFH